MSYALVGSLGTVTLGTSGASISPAYGQTPTAGNTLILWVAFFASSAVVAPVLSSTSITAGWTAGPTVNDGSRGAAVFYLPDAAGSDAQPTINAGTITTYAGQLGEFSGGVGLADKSGTGTAGSSPDTVTSSAADTATGELVAYAAGERISVSGTGTMAHTASFPNNYTANDTTNNATTTQTHYLFGYGITTANASADQDKIIFDAANSNCSACQISFLVSLPIPDAIASATDFPATHFGPF